ITDNGWEKVLREMEKDKLEYHFAYVDTDTQTGWRDVRESLGYSRENPRILSIFILESIGNKAAINCTLSISGAGGAKGRELQLNHCTGKKTIAVLWNMGRRENRTAYRMALRYYDLYHNLYEQVFTIDLSRWEDTIGFDIPHEQALIERGKY
ncbi:MAG: hypothetical protein WCP73_07755, partial [Eubacteriales bacterium]